MRRSAPLDRSDDVLAVCATIKGSAALGAHGPDPLVTSVSRHAVRAGRPCVRPRRCAFACESHASGLHVLLSILLPEVWSDTSTPLTKLSARTPHCSCRFPGPQRGGKAAVDQDQGLRLRPLPELSSGPPRPRRAKTVAVMRAQRAPWNGKVSRRTVDSLSSRFFRISLRVR